MEYLVHMHGMEYGQFFTVPKGVRIYFVVPHNRVMFPTFIFSLNESFKKRELVDHNLFAECYDECSICPNVSLAWGTSRDIHTVKQTVSSMGVYTKDSMNPHNEVSLDDSIYTPNVHKKRYQNSIILPKYNVTGEIPDELTLEQLTHIFGDGSYYMCCCRTKYPSVYESLCRIYIHSNPSIVCDELIRDIWFRLELGKWNDPSVIGECELNKYKSKYLNSDYLREWIAIGKYSIKEIESRMPLRHKYDLPCDYWFDEISAIKMTISFLETVYEKDVSK